YKYKGLPPGPINLPNIKSLDAVLNYESHNYIFMCAKEDFSGYHNFAKNYNQHLVYARKYQRELNKRKIY
ncbi:MAG: endolytic transglycosylase MltG, partial [Vicingaceae bacterium]|nr:endolytic transglycosylase MltG [Vicingaceae bacterium]